MARLVRATHEHGKRVIGRAAAAENVVGAEIMGRPDKPGDDDQEGQEVGARPLGSTHGLPRRRFPASGEAEG
ncbi:hypothetical protein [Phenylobacterium sp.]|uniref:hypothetical protein n=1 Tax=Phenylobacterium sp. TaxID=1871053 RepID=UPI00356532D7